jgi:hypothetical protein
MRKKKKKKKDNCVRVPKPHNMKAYRRVEVKLHVYVTSIVDGGVL